MVRRFFIFGFRCVVCTLLLKSGCKPAQKHPCDFVVNYEEFIQPSFPAWFKASKPLGTSIIWNCSNDNCHWEEKIAIEKAPLASALVIVLPCCSLQMTLTKICWYSLLLNLILKMSKKSVTIVKEKLDNCQRKRHTFCPAVGRTVIIAMVMVTWLEKLLPSLLFSARHQVQCRARYCLSDLRGTFQPRMP